MDEELDVILVGCEVDQRQVEAGLVRVFGIEPREARRVLGALPALAKRGASRALAERYFSALRSIGATAELRPMDAPGSSAYANGIEQLPVPASALVAHVDESMRVQRATERAIKRFRAAEGLDEHDDGPGVDLRNPAIPKAPPLPRDLSRMPNAATPRWSDPPSWSEPPGDQNGSLAPVREHVDAQPPPPPSGTPPASGPQLRNQVHASMRPHSVGLAHGARASVRPGLSAPIPQVTATRRLARGRWAVLLLSLLAAGLYVLWRSR
jgi:hypothetical protein